MKPFRGKPEKPERSKGEIHSRLVVGVRRSCDEKHVLRSFSHLLSIDPVTNACTFLLVGRRDPLSVGLRLEVEPVDERRFIPSLSHLRTLVFPIGSLDGIRTV